MSNEIEASLDADIKDSLNAFSDNFGGEDYTYHHVPEVGLIARHYDEDGNVDASWLVTFSTHKYEIPAA
jgi:hypothetical protein